MLGLSDKDFEAAMITMLKQAFMNPFKSKKKKKGKPQQRNRKTKWKLTTEHLYCSIFFFTDFFPLSPSLLQLLCSQKQITKINTRWMSSIAEQRTQRKELVKWKIGRK